MPNVSSFSDFITDWERLLAAVNNNESNLPDLTPQLQPLEDLLNEAKTLGTRQDASRAALSADAKRRREVIFEGRAAATRLRSALKGHFGSHNERLVEFGARPIRARRSRPLVDPPLAVEDPAPPVE